MVLNCIKYKITEETMYKEKNIVLNEETETVSDDTNKDTSIHNNKQYTSKEASIDNIPDINEVLPSSGVFSYPLLEEFLGTEDTRPSILNEVEFVTGNFGTSVGLRLKDTWYRSNSKTILDETKKLQETKNIPCRVSVSKKRSKTGRIFHTLRGGAKE